MDLTLSEKLHKEIAQLNPSPVVELFELDTTPCGDEGDVLYFHNGTSGYSVPVSFMGISYTPMPIRVSGFELANTGEPARPTLSILNAGGFVSAMVLKMTDLIGATLTRRRTFARFLDGEVDAAPVQYPPDIFKIVQKTREDRVVVEFELGSGMDLDGVKYPVRTIVASYCQHVYRGLGCGYARNMVIAGPDQIPLTGVLRFREEWQNSQRYQSGDSVFFDSGTDQSIYVCSIVSGEIYGDEHSPLNTSEWTRVQRYLGPYSATSSYEVGDVVYTQTATSRQYYYCMRAAPMGIKPPNAVYWRIDECGKSLNHCRWRFDPRRSNRTALPYGGFPGTLSIPEV